MVLVELLFARPFNIFCDCLQLELHIGVCRGGGKISPEIDFNLHRWQNNTMVWFPGHVSQENFEI